jgi:hypothetical protein
MGMGDQSHGPAALYRLKFGTGTVVTGARCWWRGWLRHCATSRKVAGSIPDGIIRCFIDIIYPAAL